MVLPDIPTPVELSLDKFYRKNLPELPRFGLMLPLSRKLDLIEWFGRGPHDNYQDRKTSALVSVYKKNLNDFYFSYERPQETGNKEDVFWADFSSKNIIVGVDGGIKSETIKEPYNCGARMFVSGTGILNNDLGYLGAVNDLRKST